MTGPRPKLLQSKLASTLDTSKPLTLCTVRSDFALPFQHVCAFTTNHPKLQACPQYPRGKFPRVTPHSKQPPGPQDHAWRPFTSTWFKPKKVLMKIAIATNSILGPPV